MKFEIKRQESYSRGELLLRTFFGAFYIALPHAFVLMFLGIWSGIINFIAFWTILFTGKYPESMWEFQVKYIRWNTRLSASLMNLVDGYPAFGLDSEHPNVVFEVEYPDELSRGDLLLKAFFGFIYVIIPHVFVLYFRMIATMVVNAIAFWVVLFTGNYPEGMHKFVVETLRWSTRLNLYYGNWMSDKYPPFNGRPDEDQA